jgi:hypothetical protein
MALSLAAPASAQERVQEGGIMGPYAGQVRTAGPTTVCGHAFALRLVAGEAVRRQDGPDFFLFYVDAADGAFLLYEGNFPQPHDDEIATGAAFPAIIAIHDNRSAEAKARGRVRDRLLTGGAFRAACPAGQAR